MVFKSRYEQQAHNYTIHNAAPDCPVCKKHITTAKEYLKQHLIKQHNYFKLQAKAAAGCKLTKNNGKSFQFHVHGNIFIVLEINLQKELEEEAREHQLTEQADQEIPFDEGCFKLS